MNELLKDYFFVKGLSHLLAVIIVVGGSFLSDWIGEKIHEIRKNR